jgi:hypothetical protein
MQHDTITRMDWLYACPKRHRTQVIAARNKDIDP